MPTGLTYIIEKGGTFEAFVWACARQLGALVMLRDDACEAPIPERLPSCGTEHHEKHLLAAEAALAAARAWSPEEAQTAAQIARAREERGRREIAEGKAATRARYLGMLARVRAWEPPTPEHAGLKALMERQIIESIEHDCSAYEPGPLPEAHGEAFREQRIERAERDLTYHKKELKKCQRLDAERQAWVDALRAVVPPTAARAGK